MSEKGIISPAERRKLEEIDRDEGISAVARGEVPMMLNTEEHLVTDWVIRYTWKVLKQIGNKIFFKTPSGYFVQTEEDGKKRTQRLLSPGDKARIEEETKKMNGQS